MDLKLHLSRKTYIGLTENNNIYLGSPLFIWRNKIKDFRHLLEKIASLIEGCQAKFLSHAEKVTLIKSVVQVIPVYTMNTFKILKTICKKSNSLIKKLW